VKVGANVPRQQAHNFGLHERRAAMTAYAAYASYEANRAFYELARAALAGILALS